MKGKNIFITGGTGSIGSEFVRQVLKQEPESVTIYSRDEYKQFFLQHELNDKRVKFVIGDVRNKEQLMKAMCEADVVIHAAAMKHVPICEYNPYEAVLTNVLGTQNVVDCAKEVHAEKVLVISTDKAANPTSVLGASKLLAERLTTAAYYNQDVEFEGDRTRFCVVRFGNVLWSRGSVLELWKKQIEEKNEITITDGEMTRFCMTISEAVSLCLKALEKVEANETYILKMPAVKLKDLAACIQEKNEWEDSAEIIHCPQIRTIGLRAGEKMYEELMTEAEGVNAQDLGDMFKLYPTTLKITAQREKPISYSSQDARMLTREEVMERI